MKIYWDGSKYLIIDEQQKHVGTNANITWSKDDTKFTITTNYGTIVERQLLSETEDSGGTPYASRSAFETAIDSFFVEASAGGGVSTFAALTDVTGAFTTGNALYKANSTPDGLEETTTLLTEPAANQFQIARGTSALLAQGDLTIESDSFINQDLTTDASPTFTLVNTGTVQNSGDLILGYDSQTLTLSVVGGATNFNPSTPVNKIQYNVADTRTTFQIQGGPVSATGGEARMEFIHGNGTSSTRWDQQATNNLLTFNGFSNYIINSGLAAVNTIIRGDTDANLLRANSGDTVTIGTGTALDSAKLYVSGKISTSDELEVNGDFNHDGTNVGFYGTAPVAKPTVTGAKGGNVALTSLLTQLASLGLITDSTT